MTRKGILVLVAMCLATNGNLFANDELAVTELYGQAVHSYFDGEYEAAHKSLSDAIDLGTDDPRVYYFRGLSKMRLGRSEEATKDFEQGGKLEAQGAAQFYPVGRSLERIQGTERVAIEKVRKQARIAIRLRQKKIEAARIEAFKRDERLRKSGPAVKLGTPSANTVGEDDPFGTSGAPAEKSDAPVPAKPSEPAKDADPFGSPAKPAEPAKDADPFGAPAKPAEPAKDADPFGAPEKKAEPAKDADPFAEPSKKAEPSKDADPFAEPSKKAEPSKDADPFAEPSKKAEPSKDADPFAEPSKKADAKNDDPFAGGSDDDPFAPKSDDKTESKEEKKSDDPFGN